MTAKHDKFSAEQALAYEYEKLKQEEYARKVSRRRVEYAAWRPGTVIEYDSWVHQGIGLVVAVYDREVEGTHPEIMIKRRFAFVVWDSRCQETCKEYEIARINPHVIYTVIP